MADNITNTTTLGTASPTLVSTRAIYYYEKLRVFRPLLGPNASILVPNNALIFKVNQLDTLTFGAHTQGTGQDAEAFTTTGRDLTPVILSTNVLTALEAYSSTPASLEDWFAEAAGTAWAALEDDNSTYGFAALYADCSNLTSAPDHTLGANGTALDASLCRQGVTKLMSAGAKKPYNWVIDPIQFEELMRDSEAKQYLMNTRGANTTYAATTGVDMDRYLGQLYGCHVWVGNAMIESTGLHSIMFGQDGIGIGYKMVQTPNSGAPAEMAVDMVWEGHEIGWRTTFIVYMDTGGIAWTATNNKFIVDIIS